MTIETRTSAFRRATKPAGKLALFALVCLAAYILSADFGQPAQAAARARSYSSIRRQMQDARARLNSIHQQHRSVLDDIEQLDSKAELMESQMAQANHDIHVMQEQLGEAKEKLAGLENELVRRKSLVAERVDTTYMQGEVTYLELLFNASDFREFINRSFYLNLIFEKDQELILGVKDQKVKVDEERQKLDRAVADIARAREKLAGQKADIAAARQEKEVLVKAIEHDETLAEKQYEELQEESRRVTQFLRTASGYSGKWTGRFLQPVQGHIGSGFGPRVHPISHRVQTHTGVDIGAPYGTPIRAAGDGKVVLVGRERGYGNHIIIDHGGGVATHYAHCSRFAVSVGDVVKAGQVIAYVGSTGYSTGPHLHFEVLVHGAPVNPLGKM